MAASVLALSKLLGVTLHETRTDKSLIHCYGESPTI